MPTHFGDASKEGNDTHRRRRRQLQPKLSRIFIQTIAHLPPLPSEPNSRCEATPPLPQHLAVMLQLLQDTDPSHGQEHADQPPGPTRMKKKHQHHHHSSLARNRRPQAGLETPLLAVSSQPSRGCAPGARTRETIDHRLHAPANRSSPRRETQDRAPRSGHAATSSPRRSLPPPRRRQQEAHRAPRPPQRLPAAAPGPGQDPPPRSLRATPSDTAPAP